MGFAKPINTANGFINLGAAMRTAGYTGGPIVSSIGIFNPHASTIAYIHLTESGTTAPVTSTDGWPIGAGATAVGPAFYADRGANQSSLDINTTWISCGAIIPLQIIAVGA